MDGYVIKAIRDKSGLTQKQFAERLRVAESTIAQIESFMRKVSRTVRFRVSNEFDVTPEILEAAARARNADRLCKENMGGI